MTLSRNHVLITNGYLSIEGVYSSRPIADLHKNRHLVTVLSNLNYYGYMPSQETLEVLNSLDAKALAAWWTPVEKVIQDITADDRRMDDFVVYQNFPKEVLEMSQSEYWFKQILMYFGLDKELVSQEKVDRDPLFEDQTLKVLHLANERTLHDIFNSLLDNKSRWTAPQQEQVEFLLKDLQVRNFTTASISFRENGIQVINSLMDSGEDVNITVEDATDVLRPAALRSEQDVSLREKVKFKNFARRERRILCSMLENSKHLEGDVAERTGLFKLLFRRLHPGDFNFPRVSKTYDDLYNGRLKSFASRVETGISSQDPEVFKLLMSRPGEFVRRFHHLYGIFGGWSVGALTEVMPRLTTHQLLKLDGYLRTINSRAQMVYPPRGNWNKLKIVPNTKAKIEQDALDILRDKIHQTIRDRLQTLVPEGFDVQEELDLVKLQTNDQELASYGRGTVFPIPENMTFLRTASYWENKGRTSWFDNGWNFFDSAWQPKGTICWNRTSMGGAAVFSGDPVNSKEMRGRACQMIDLYIDRLLKKGVRYAVWNILCYSHVKFSDASGEVLGTLQWGESPQKGKLYEPSRAQMIFPITGENLTKYIAYIDLKERKLVYMDANLRGSVSSAGCNESILSETMPAFVEYLDALPSVADLLCHHEGTVPALYSDKDTELTDEQLAYVFKTENEGNSLKQLDLTKLL